MLYIWKIFKCTMYFFSVQAHIALAKYEKFLKDEAKGRKLTVITQNIDELHTQAGSKNVIEMHGSLFKTKCTSCGHIEVNRKNPICPILKGRGWVISLILFIQFS